MKFQFMKNQSSCHCIKIMANLLKVSRSGYYAWFYRPKAKRMLENEILVIKIKQYQKNVKNSYGSKRLTLEIKEKEGIALGHNRVARLMRENNVGVNRKRRWKKPKEEKNLKIKISNILNRNFNVIEPNKVWVSDITYIRTTSGWRYHCSIMDLFSKMIIGRSFGRQIDTGLVINAVNHALINRGNPRDVLFHSDRGSQYCGKKFRKALSRNNFRQSLSRRGNCWDNACIESFFKSLKYEWLYPEGLVSPRQAEMLIFEYIEIFYNRKRRHSSLGYVSPAEYEKMVRN